LKGVLDTGSKTDIESKTRELSDTLQKVGQAMYGSQGAGGQPGAENAQPGADSATGSESTPPNSDEPVEGEVVK
jgi:molecular chaperone DnaK